MIGQDFEGEVQRLRSEADWNARLAEARDADVLLPAYYTQPFHAYENGELQAVVLFHAPLVRHAGGCQTSFI